MVSLVCMEFILWEISRFKAEDALFCAGCRASMFGQTSALQESISLNSANSKPTNTNAGVHMITLYLLWYCSEMSCSDWRSC